MILLRSGVFALLLQLVVCAVRAGAPSIVSPKFLPIVMVIALTAGSSNTRTVTSYLSRIASAVS